MGEGRTEFGDWSGDGLEMNVIPKAVGDYMQCFFGCNPSNGSVHFKSHAQQHKTTCVPKEPSTVTNRADTELLLIKYLKVLNSTL